MRRAVLPNSGAPGASVHAIRGFTVGSILDEVAEILALADIADPRLEARDLVAAIAGEPRFWPVMHVAATLTDSAVQRIRQAADKRARGAPFAYAVGLAAFRYLTLHVDERVLIPRQETEVLIDLVLRQTATLADGIVADVGTGSGAIALALATEGRTRFERIVATDISGGAVSVAANNYQRVKHDAAARVEFRLGHALAPLVGETLDVLVANPPYCAFSELDALPRSVRDWEPSAALVSGEGGLALTSEIVAGAPAVLQRGGLIALECDSRRADVVATLLANDGRYDDVCLHKDLTGRDRFVLARRA